MDWSFDLFSRAWCVAELARAYYLGMNQRLVMPCLMRLQRCESKLHGLKVQDMQASRPEDVQEILAKIPDQDSFNRRLQDLLFNSSTGAIAIWRTKDSHKRLQRSGRLARWNAIVGGRKRFWEHVSSKYFLRS